MRSEARQRQILACAKRVFAERGFHAANVSHICEAAKIGRGTLYLYFANKHSVLTAILRDTLERVRAVMERMSAAAGPIVPPEKVTRESAIRFSARQLRELLKVVFEDDDTLCILLREAVGLDVDVEKLLGEIDDVLISIVERDLVRARDAGFIRDLDPRAVATLVVGGIEKLALRALRSDAPVDLDALALEATRLHSIGTLSDRLKPDSEAP
jgi:AcrR family transcriptional regulator